MTHPTGEQLAAYWLGELDDAAVVELEEHVFACDPCAAACSRTEQVIAGVRALLPPVISSARLAELRAAVPGFRHVEVAPGASATVEFRPGDQLFLLRLQADLSRAQRVDFSIEEPGGGATLYEAADAPFDAQAGVVNVVCQRHFVGDGYPLLVHMRVRAFRDGEPAEVGLYAINHVVV